MHYSALLGQPPATPDDYWIARSLLLSAGLTNVDPSQGAKIRLSRPPPHQYRFETRAPSIIAGSAVSIVIMVVITVTRLLIRCFDGGVQFGADDWLIIPGVVCILGLFQYIERVRLANRSYLPPDSSRRMAMPQYCHRPLRRSRETHL